MHTTKLLFMTIAVASLVTSFKLPANLQDGVYMASYDASGTEIHVALNTTTPASSLKMIRDSTRSNDIQERDYGFGVGILTSWCGCDYPLDPGNCDKAVQRLKNQCNNNGGSCKIPYASAWYSISNNAVTFACNDNSASTSAITCVIDASYLTSAYSFITAKCGQYIAGTMLYEDWGIENDAPYVGYMQYYSGLNFCNDAESANESKC
ncbi:hypothetical protein BP5796_03062 [Coleophoma crateriformis]|uniref:Ecp2 effector protein domain-containing protein n=1 Tax=Coleophoma crateriformis TaxID=565419 RepID=A0A3D8SNI9_9HELO|nr:hypothetical protein BP5796_03062 [Coleophoma crateriformis]